MCIVKAALSNVMYTVKSVLFSVMNSAKCNIQCAVKCLAYSACRTKLTYSRWESCLVTLHFNALGLKLASPEKFWYFFSPTVLQTECDFEQFKDTFTGFIENFLNKFVFVTAMGRWGVKIKQ